MSSVSVARRKWRQGIVRALATVGLIATVGVGLTGLGNDPAAAVSASDFQPGNIISDSNFYKGDAMTEAQIQSFLVSKGSVLANYRSSVSSRSANISDRALPGHVYCAAFQGGSNLLASTLIYRAQVACGISAKVILVTLEKEQGLVTRSTASAGVLNIAMGYGCPDTAPCDTDYYGLGNQLYMASLQFKYYQLPQNGYRYQPGSEYVQFHPNASCSGTTINIRNAATAGLYNYTPYQPNAASLRSFPGTGDSCSSYGNRNFFFIYSNWFGSSAAVDPLQEINAHYLSLGGSSSELGAANAAPSCTWAASASCTWTYAHGVIHWVRYGVPIAVMGNIGDYYLSVGGVASALGAPAQTGAEVTDPNGNGTVQKFAGGWIHSSAAGTFATSNKVMPAYSAAGWLRGYLGWPVAAESCGGAAGFCVQEFSGGALYGSPAGVNGAFGQAVWDLYSAAGGSSGSLGYPLQGSAAVVDPNGNGTVQKFAGGWIHSSAAGTFATSNSLMPAYSAAGWVRGELGWPTGAETCNADSCSQHFSGGHLVKPADGAGFVVPAITNDKIQLLYAEMEGSIGPLGLAVGQTTAVTDPNGNGTVQKFAGGWIHSSAAGTFATSNKLMTAYSAAGWLRGYLGWPTAAEVCDANGCSQAFSGWRLFQPTSGSVYAVPEVTEAKVKALYDSMGGAASSLGQPAGPSTAVTDPNGNGLAQKFAGGWIHSSAAGTFATSNKLMTAYSVAGWLRGYLGWPTAAEVCDANGCSQQFAGGTLVQPTSGTSYAVPAITNAGMRALYDSLGGAGGWLGLAVGQTTAVVDPNGNGFVQRFAGGWIHSSAAGAFATSNELMAAYSAAGWLRGYLGWPVSAETCNASECSQQFSGGLLTK